MSDYQQPTSLIDKELLLDQRGIVVWFTGLSGAGKSTLAFELEKKFYDQGYLTQVLDGDILRMGLCRDLGFSQAERKENIRRVAEVSRLFCNSGMVTITAFISPTKEIRELARTIIGKERFFEIYINTSLEVCENRDTKGLYKKARQRLVPEFTGISSPYEAPENPFMSIDTSKSGIAETAELLFKHLLPEVKHY
jgi:adenylylsulfate kinase